MTTTEQSTYRQVPDLEVHEADDGLIVFNADTDRVHHLNPAAGVLFELCAQPRTPAGLLESLAALYQRSDLPQEEIQRSLSQLVAEGLLQESRGE